MHANTRSIRDNRIDGIEALSAHSRVLSATLPDFVPRMACRSGETGRFLRVCALTFA
jgi:hypothetical protein